MKKKLNVFFVLVLLFVATFLFSSCDKKKILSMEEAESYLPNLSPMFEAGLISVDYFDNYDTEIHLKELKEVPFEVAQILADSCVTIIITPNPLSVSIPMYSYLGISEEMVSCHGWGKFDSSLTKFEENSIETLDNWGLFVFDTNNPVIVLGQIKIVVDDELLESGSPSPTLYLIAYAYDLVMGVSASKEFSELYECCDQNNILYKAETYENDINGAERAKRVYFADSFVFALLEPNKNDENVNNLMADLFVDANKYAAIASK